MAEATYIHSYIKCHFCYVIHRCMYLLSATGRHYGCINANTSWSTPSFEALGLLRIMSVTDHENYLLKGIVQLYINAMAMVHYLNCVQVCLSWTQKELSLS